MYECVRVGTDPECVCMWVRVCTQVRKSVCLCVHSIGRSNTSALISTNSINQFYALCKM